MLIVRNLQLILLLAAGFSGGSANALERVTFPVLQCVHSESGQRRQGSSIQPITFINNCGYTVSVTWDANGPGHPYGRGSNRYSTSIEGGGRRSASFDTDRTTKIPYWVCPQSHKGHMASFDNVSEMCEVMIP